jgi:type I restriction enzyme, S subunit
MKSQASGKLNFGGYPLAIEPPKGWVMSSLGKIAEEIRPGFASGEHNKEGEGIPHLRPMNINAQGSIDLSEVRYVAPAKGSLRLQRDDILFNNTNSQVWVGKTAFVQEDAELAFSNHMTRIRVNQEVAKSEFLARQLHFLTASGYFRLHCKRHVNQASVASGLLEETVPLLIPPLNEQIRIIDRVYELNSHANIAREALEAVPELLDQLRQSVLAAAFRGDLTRKWREDHPDAEPASELLKRIRIERRKLWEKAELEKLKAKGITGEKLDSEFAKRRKQYNEPAPVDTANLPELPDGWCWCPLSEIGYINRGKSRHRPRNAPHLYGGKYPFIQTGDISQSNGLITNHKQTYSDAGLKQSKLWPEGTVCITIAANIASSAILTYPACFPDSVVGIRPDIRLCPPEYVEFFIRTVRNELDQFAPATAQKNINIEILNNVIIPLPPRKEVDEILRLVRVSFKSVEPTERELRSSLAKLVRLDQAILSKAFSGELVPQDPNDEPASALLDRIRAEKALVSVEEKTKAKGKGRRVKRQPLQFE